MKILNLLIIFIFAFILFSCTNNINTYKADDNNKIIDKSIRSEVNNYRIILENLDDINKINENTGILIIYEIFWKKYYHNIMLQILKFNFKEGPLIINIIGNGNNKYYKISEDEAKLFKEIKSKTFLFLYNNGKNKGITFCSKEIKNILDSKNYICGN